MWLPLHTAPRVTGRVEREREEGRVGVGGGGE